MLLSWSATDWLAVLSGLAYVWLAARGKRMCWVFGILSSSVIAWEDFLNLRLYSDGVLQIIYIIMGVWGWITWGKQELHHSIVSKSWGFHMALIALSMVLTMPVAGFFSIWTNAAFPVVDAWTTVISLIASWLTVRKILENWLYWIVADLIYIYLYFERGAPAFAILFVIYTVLAAYGWLSWRHKREQVI